MVHGVNSGSLFRTFVLDDLHHLRQWLSGEPHLTTPKHVLTYAQLVTFDPDGVSKHPNHIALADVHAHLNPYLDTAEEVPRPVLLQLESPSLATKYTGPIWAVVCALRELAARVLGSSPEGDAPESATLISSPVRYAKAIRAMLAHRSQLVWFRWLYVSFSQLMWVNRLIDLGH